MTVNELYDKYLASCRIDKKCVFNQLTEDQIKLLFEKLLTNSHLNKCLTMQPFLFFRRNHTKLLNNEIRLLFGDKVENETRIETKKDNLVNTEENKIKINSIIDTTNNSQNQKDEVIEIKEEEKEKEITNSQTIREKQIDSLFILDENSGKESEIVETKRKRGRPRKYS